MREQQNNKRDRTTIGLDLGDQWHRFCVLRISKRGDIYLRRLLVSSAQYILGPLAPPSALRQYGPALAAGATPRAKKRAVVAVARKLAVLLLTLWKNKTPYQAFFPQQRKK